jgi:hypothetical protein
MGLLPWDDAETATVRWTAAGNVLPLPTCVIRLGEAVGVEILYDPDAKETLRLPQASIAVVIKAQSHGC